MLAAALIALAWFLSQVVRLALSRSRELMADAGSVELTKDPDAMISALRKIENRGELPGATSAVMEMCIDNPREGFTDLFATHPSVDARVRALVTYAGGHDPGPMRSHYQYERDQTGDPETAHLPDGPAPHGPWSDPTPSPTAKWPLDQVRGKPELASPEASAGAVGLQLNLLKLLTNSAGLTLSAV